MDDWIAHTRGASYVAGERREIDAPAGGEIVLVDAQGNESTLSERDMAQQFASSEVARAEYERDEGEDHCFNHNKDMQHHLPRARTGGTLIVTCSCLHILNLEEVCV
jgi:hypothetical protein